MAAPTPDECYSYALVKFSRQHSGGVIVQIRNPKDFGAGIMFIAFGVIALLIARDYSLGTASRMGPGYFPRGLSFIMLGIGAILVLRALKLQGPPIIVGALKPLVIVILSVVVFGLAAPTLGMIVATVALVLVSSVASDEFRWKEAIVASIVLALFVVAAFGYGLKLQLPLLPWFLE
jgi:hypothetical protein